MKASEVSNGSLRRSRLRTSSQREPFPLPGTMYASFRVGARGSARNSPATSVKVNCLCSPPRSRRQAGALNVIRSHGTEMERWMIMSRRAMPSSGLAAWSRVFSSKTVSSPPARLESHGIRPTDLGKAIGSRLLCAEDQAPVDDLSGCGVFDLIQADVHSELAAELDFDVANVAGLVNPPGDHAHSQRRQDGQDQKQSSGERLAQWAGHGKHPWLPACSAIRSVRRALVSFVGWVQPTGNADGPVGCTYPTITRSPLRGVGGLHPPYDYAVATARGRWVAPTLRFRGCCRAEDKDRRSGCFAQLHFRFHDGYFATPVRRRSISRVNTPGANRPSGRSAGDSARAGRSMAVRIASRLVPTYFSTTAAAISKATTFSTITLAAGTAQTSERS